jgi:hypothetical protein
MTIRAHTLTLPAADRAQQTRAQRRRARAREGGGREGEGAEGEGGEGRGEGEEGEEVRWPDANVNVTKYPPCGGVGGVRPHLSHPCLVRRGRSRLTRRTQVYEYWFYGLCIRARVFKRKKEEWNGNWPCQTGARISK